MAGQRPAVRQLTIFFGVDCGMQMLIDEPVIAHPGLDEGQPGNNNQANRQFHRAQARPMCWLDIVEIQHTWMNLTEKAFALAISDEPL